MSRAQPRLVAIALFALLATTGLSAQTTGSDGKRKAPSKVTFHKAPSEESPQAREKRLKRECRGRPNAGMCAGYTR
ncbi:hypothetical protein [Hydrogenophaga sp.]|jgi:hypothetical protein|uniref:hypothetical protein n=1 Tax=Hydrogenophaga sp. TaxID=1904254 RepID=UPI003F70CB82